jgi:hypothetical protein
MGERKMSAYLVDYETIALLAAGYYLGSYLGADDFKTKSGELARCLLAENIASLEYRYPATDISTSKPDPLETLAQWSGLSPAEYVEGVIRTLDSLALTRGQCKNNVKWLDKVVRAAAEYQYQACEHPEWEKSKARLISAQAALECARAGIRIRNPEDRGW